MSGIPIYTTSPINASKVSGVTPQTAPPTQPNYSSTSSTPAQNAATTTAASSSVPSYPKAEPGAAAIPAPTGAAKRYVPVQPTPTLKDDGTNPPAPQPGAFPVPGGSTSSTSRNIPPPPKAGEVYQPPVAATPSTSMSQPYPHQMSVPPPTHIYGTQPPSSSTVPSTTPSYAFPVSIAEKQENHLPRRSLEHPPNYQQNPYAADLSAQQRMAVEAANADKGNMSLHDDGLGFGEDSAWNTAKQWAQVAGKKISEAENEVWRRINKD